MSVTSVQIDEAWDRGEDFKHEYIHLFGLWHPSGEYAMIQSRPIGRDTPIERELFTSHDALTAAFEQRRAQLRADGWECTRSERS
jgi:hypothetical protein